MRSREEHAAYLEAYDVAQAAKAEGRIEEAHRTIRQFVKSDAIAEGIVHRMPADGGTPQWAGGPVATPGPERSGWSDVVVNPPVTDGEMLARKEVRRQEKLAQITAQEMAALGGGDAEDLVDRTAVRAAQRAAERARRSEVSREALAAKIRRGDERIAWLDDCIMNSARGRVQAMRAERDALVRRQQGRIAQYMQQFGAVPA